MKTKLAVNSFCLAAVLALSGATLLSTGCAGNRYDRSTGEYIDDHSIITRVDKALHDNGEYKFNTVHVTCFKGDVQLSGFVDSDAQKSEADRIARTVQGVRNVQNNISVGPEGGRTTGEYIDDKSLTRRVNHALNEDPEYKFDQVTVTSLQGTVQLNGFVNRAEDKNRAGDIAKNVPGVRAVENNISVKDAINQ